jgi:hypothetical protein
MTRTLQSYIKIFTLVFLFFAGLSFKAEKDPLHKRVYNINVTEVKDGAAAAKKPVMDKMTFKDGRLFSDFLYDKFQYKWLKYRINKDSIYTDSTDTEVRLFELEATVTDELNQTVIVNLSIIEWDIDGTIKITKNDKLKKAFDLSGREKGGKPKKAKKKKKVEAPKGEAEQKPN